MRAGNIIRYSVSLAMLSLLQVPALAADGIIILQREVPSRPAYREESPGRATSVDVSPDDKVKGAVGGHGLPADELGDMDFAAVNTGKPQTSAIALDALNKGTLTSARSENNRVNQSAGYSAQSNVPIVTGQIGPPVGAATGSIAQNLSNPAGTLNGLTGAIMRTVGQ